MDFMDPSVRTDVVAHARYHINVIIRQENVRTVVNKVGREKTALNVSKY